MLHWLYKGRGIGMRFLEPSSDGKSGSGGAGGSSSGGGEADDPFKGIPLDELDEPTRNQIVKAKSAYDTTVATLQTKTAEVDNITKQSRDFQSQRDRLDAELRKVTGGKPPTEDAYLEAATRSLKESGYSDADIAKNAPVFANMLKKSNQILKSELGRELGPMANAVVQNDSQLAFEKASNEDTTGMFAIPEVSQTVWLQVQDRVKQNLPSSPELIKNLGKIAYVDHIEQLEKDGKPLPERVRSTPATPAMNTGGFTYPGAGRAGASKPIRSTPVDPNAPSTALNPDTEAALISTFKTMGSDSGIYPQAFKDKITAPRRR